VAVAIGADNAVIAQTREPATLSLAPGVSILLSDESREDTGHRLFHSSGGAFVTCASCHPEGGDDGNVWNFTGTGPRRTQNLRGGLAGTAPFHWDGDMATFAQLADEVFVGRMSAGGLLPDQVAALERWVTTQPALPSAPPDDPAAVARGREVFADPTVGCATCHAGEHLTNNATVDVGTGGRFQVPSLQGVAARTPLLHNGCARTLTDRFGACGGGESHGHTAQLLPAQLADLVAYLETL
jgi:mono/diheme cytochrome c family protein